MTTPEDQPQAHKDPLILWWMPILALVAPIIAAAWKGATADSDVLKDALVALVWPGLPLYFGLLAILWGGWKIDLE